MENCGKMGQTMAKIEERSIEREKRLNGGKSRCEQRKIFPCFSLASGVIREGKGKIVKRWAQAAGEGLL